MDSATRPSWTAGLRPCGIYYEGFVTDLEGVLQKHRVDTMSTFSIRKSRQTVAGKQQAKINSDSENQSPDTPKPSIDCRLYWRKKEGDKDIEFGDVPFTANGETLYNCQFGKEYFKQKECKNLRLRLQGTRKLGCLAHISVKQYTLYPAYQITENEKKKLSSWKLRQLREERLMQLREEIKSGSPSKEIQYFVSLPTRDAHTKHPTDEVSGYAQKVHPLIAQKISEFVSEGMTEVHEVKRALRQYVHTQFSQQYQCQPLPSDRAFHPSLHDLRNHVHKAKKALELSKIDQENLRLKLKQWKQDEPNASHYFRPYIVVDSPQLSQTDEKGKQSISGSFLGNSGGDECNEHELAGTHNECSQTFLWIYQTDWQKSLLARYGNNISMIDATYKTTKYDLALFFVCVRTNVGYIVVGQFITQSETAEQIQEALQILQTWNPEWKPRYFMCDYSEAELAALEAVFPGVTVYLCDFHREQAWERWTNERKHGLTDEGRDQLLHLLRECANAPSPPVDTHMPHTYYYDKAVETLKSSSVWRNNEQVRSWLELKWLPISQKWARCYRDDKFYAAVNTNNGVEALNKVLKYNYLPRNKNMTVSNLATLLVTTFLPESYQKYLLQNYQMSGTYRAYKDFIPSYLHGRPRNVILHCLSRMNKAKFLQAQVVLTDTMQGIFEITKPSGGKHIVNFSEPQCSCKDWKQLKLPCKHFFAVFHHYTEWGWERLPVNYLSSEYLTCDTDALAGEVSSGRLIQDDTDNDTPEQTVYENELPRKQHSVSTMKAQQALRITLKTIENLSYNCTNVNTLLAFNEELQALESRMREEIPHQNGLLLRPALITRIAKKTKMKYSKLGSLEKQKKQKASEWKFKGRAGDKAQRLRKVAAQLISLKKTTQDCHRTVPGQKRLRCGHCIGCRNEDCGQCKYCKDKPKYGGSGKKKQACIKRQCQNLGTSSEGSTYQSQPHKISKEEMEEGLYGPCRRFVKLPGSDIPDQPHVSKSNAVTKFEQQVQGFKLSFAKLLLSTSQLRYITLEPGNIVPPPTTSEDYNAIQQALLIQDRQLDAIQADGNCLFRSISKELLGRERHHTTLRNVLVNFIEHNPNLFKFLLFEENIEDHCKRMHQWGTWGSQMELQAVSCLLQVKVFVFSPRREGSGYEWRAYKPQSVPRCKLIFPKGIEKLDQPGLYHIELCHTFGVHFDRVAPQNLLLSVLQQEPQLNTFDTPPQQID